jgi:hypothetical protein
MKRFGATCGGSIRRRWYHGPPFRCRDHRTVRPLVSCLQALILRSRRNDGQARDLGRAEHHSALGPALCAGVREALESLRTPRSAAHGAWMRRSESQRRRRRRSGMQCSPPEAESLQDRSWLTNLNFAPEPDAAVRKEYDEKRRRLDELDVELGVLEREVPHLARSGTRSIASWRFSATR